MSYKITVYAICKNEKQFVNQGIQSMSEADYICILDTGSDDGTYELLKEYQEKMPGKIIIDQKIITPWRFDTARNESMKLIPADTDICMCTDLDELLIPGWADDFRAAGSPERNRLNYLYAWSHEEDGSNGRVFWYNKCHDNHSGFHWEAPVHEYVTAGHDDNENYAQVSNKVYLHHYPDQNKSRGNYLPLLEQRKEEYPTDYYGMVYLAHEYAYRGMYQKSIDFILNELLPKIQDGDPYDCVTDLEMFLGDNYRYLGQYQESIVHYYKGIQADPTFRDNYFKLGQLFLDLHQYDKAIDIINDGLKYSRRHYSGLETNDVWTFQGPDMLCQAYYFLDAKDTALMYAKMAMELDTNNQRLKDNYHLIEQELL